MLPNAEPQEVAEPKTKTAATRNRTPRHLHSPKDWKRILRRGVTVAMILTGIAMGALLWRRAGSLVAWRPQLTSAAVVAPSANAAAANGPAQAVAAPAARVPAARFEPKLSRKYRGSYTENVLYLENYVDAEQNADFRRRWMSELSKAASR